jgi:hypothetical protein
MSLGLCVQLEELRQAIKQSYDDLISVDVECCSIQTRDPIEITGRTLQIKIFSS